MISLHHLRELPDCEIVVSLPEDVALVPPTLGVTAALVQGGVEQGDGETHPVENVSARKIF